MAVNVPNLDLFSSWYPFIFAVVVGFLYGIRQYLRGAKYKSTTRLNGKTAIVTGSNCGIGKATALELAKQGARVILACRDAEKGAAAANEIQKEADNINVYFLKCDLASFQSIREFVEEFQKNNSELHILINNAGVMMCPKMETEEKFELQFGVNYLGHFLLTHLLLDVLKISTPSRIINITAHAYRLGKINFDDINCSLDFNSGNAFAQSKLAVCLFTIELAKRLADTQVTVNCVNPGVVNSNIHRHLVFRTKAMVRFAFTPFVYYLMKSEDDGAASVVFGAVDDSLQQVSGKYIVECSQSEWDVCVQNENLRRKLWEESLKWTELGK